MSEAEYQARLVASLRRERDDWRKRAEAAEARLERLRQPETTIARLRIQAAEAIARADQTQAELDRARAMLSRDERNAVWQEVRA